jgi:hypothetical protein
MTAQSDVHFKGGAMRSDKRFSQAIPFATRKIRMVGCRAVGKRFRGFIGHSTKGYVGDPTYRELSCDILCDTSAEAMSAAHELSAILAIKYGFSHART